jgi:hypothetical protein
MVNIMVSCIDSDMQLDRVHSGIVPNNSACEGYHSMKAKDCIDGQLYDLPASAYYTEYHGAICQGMNNTKELVLFLLSDLWKGRVIRTMLPDAEVEESK